jgi:hypothetical protein
MKRSLLVSFFAAVGEECLEALEQLVRRRWGPAGEQGLLDVVGADADLLESG